jgi:putative hydrolase of the HAD superfamily
MIRNVVFDLGGVLITWRPDEIAASFYTDPELSAALLEHVLRHPDWLEMDRGTYDETELARRFAARMARPVEEMAALFEHVRASLLPIGETAALLTDLHARGLALYALSNMAVPMFRHIERYDFFRSFNGIVVSADVRLVKPDPAIFEHLAQRFGLAFDESVFVDDVAANVETARRLGMAAIRFESAAQCGRELERLL